MKHKKKFIVIASMIMLVVVIGISYAWLSSTILGKNEEE